MRQIISIAIDTERTEEETAKKILDLLNNYSDGEAVITGKNETFRLEICPKCKERGIMAQTDEPMCIDCEDNIRSRAEALADAAEGK